MTAASTQAIQALDRANAIRTEGAKSRRLLSSAPPRVLREAVVDPNPGLASMTLARLFAQNTHNPIRQFGPRALGKALADLNARTRFRQDWHSELRLRDLTRRERQLLMEAITQRAPQAWREELEGGSNGS